jgi:hypothetical protein
MRALERTCLEFAEGEVEVGLFCWEDEALYEDKLLSSLVNNGRGRGVVWSIRCC